MNICCSFWSINKAAFAYGKTDYIEVGNPNRYTGEGGQGQEECEPAAQEKCQQQMREKDARTEVMPWLRGDIHIIRHELIYK